ncbi:IS1595 family transposase [Alkalitalea saponilacus]|uniref:ISXO2-like transposase domain-containing protein n=1 Tax=Alkalitalea saponilacus TaxID=889453 RepID=A0A1T5B7Y2_9BACT|nr:IS1595 family transposase [Alkalitalea saponilacus]ASB47756.1 IS1595 family transposase [Alkalitalea saponilacus]ASB49764.1 IS1595 family transposase [Alkalitalea saponilacus]SKB43368.1 ISXO2-like transposase domain-containing protein [Alkalitalea saponilacus]SKB55474.1 ISXO2-like transposase domain-containing protein [Alkalitalea saponilacus]SKC21007.1 ISXO2-like transposase domain-containing protein [Alkalitalea saponilacus]
MNERNKFKGVNSIKFYNAFPSENDCYRYLADVKWFENGYQCKKCNHTKYYKGVKPFSRRCMKCKYDESPTAGTMFDKCKFSLHLAFHIAFKISTKKKGMSSLELSQEFELRQKTCWEFKWKIQQAMQSSKQHTINGIAHVDEFYIGGEEEGKRGRSKGDKKLVVVALEIVEGGVGRAYAQCIDNASAASFQPFFKTYISKDTKVITDEWKGYIPLKKTYPNLEQLKSENGKSFQDIHIHIMNLKGWLRGIHHHCSKDRLQGYLDEYHFRYNRRSNMDTIFDSLIKRMVFNNPIRLQSVN